MFHMWLSSFKLKIKLHPIIWWHDIVYAHSFIDFESHIKVNKLKIPASWRREKKYSIPQQMQFLRRKFEDPCQSNIQIRKVLPYCFHFKMPSKEQTTNNHEGMIIAGPSVYILNPNHIISHPTIKIHSRLRLKLILEWCETDSFTGFSQNQCIMKQNEYGYKNKIC